MLRTTTLGLFSLCMLAMFSGCASDTAGRSSGAVEQGIDDCRDRLAECDDSADDCEAEAMDCIGSVDGEGAGEDDIEDDCDELHELCMTKTDDGQFCDDLHAMCMECADGHDGDCDERDDCDDDDDSDCDDCGEDGSGGHGGGDGGGDGGEYARCDHEGEAGHECDDFDCDGSPSFDRFDNLYVRYGDSCELIGKTVYGNVYVEEYASLSMLDTYVGGNLQASDARAIEVAMSRIGGNLQIKGTSGEPAETLSIGENEIKGNLQVEKNYVAFDILNNYVGGDLQFFENVAESDHTIFKNVIGQNLQCKENAPYSILGGQNVVYGSAEDQCYDLAAR